MSFFSLRYLKTNSGKKGEGMPVFRNPQYYFKEGFCWSNVLTTYIKCRKKQKTIHSTESMSFFSVSDYIPEYYIICIMNSHFIAYYIDSFVNSTSHCTTGDAKLIPIIIPTKYQLNQFESLFNSAYMIKQAEYSNQLSIDKAEIQLTQLQEKIDNLVNKLYNLI